MRLFSFIILSSLILSCSIGCSRPPAQFQLPYELNKPDKKFELGNKLNEISGMTYLGNKKIAVIQDEKGSVFIFSVKSGKIVDEIKFGIAGDYEGLASLDDKFYAITSDGAIHIIEPTGDSKAKVVRISLGTSKKSEMEGICYLGKKKSFLLCYKTASGLSSDSRSIYLYKANKSYHASLPYFTLTNQKLQRYVNSSDQKNGNLKKILDKAKSGVAVFQPSGIAVHPVTGHIYVISGVNELLVVVDPKTKSISYAQQFDKDLLSQPEGITFDKDGDLYISSEKGSAKDAHIIRFEMLD